MLILPIRTDSPLRRRPVVNYAIIGLNVAVFVLLWLYSVPEARIRPFELNGAHPKLYQFITYAFLHADIWHLLGNMLFLYIFGNSLNDKMGHIEYSFFYLAAAVFSGAGYALTSSANLLGASGAIAAVTTGFLVLFPRSNILVFIWIFYFIDTWEFSSLFLIAFKMVLLDNVILPAVTVGPRSNVAYGAHLIGYLFGFVVPLVLLAVRALDRDQFDILALWSRIIRRKQFAHVAEHQSPYIADRLRSARPVEATVLDASLGPATLDHSAPIAQLRNAIFESLAHLDLTTAVEHYRRLLAQDPAQVLPRKEQLEIANQLMSLQDFTAAADAYEKFLAQYPGASQTEQVQLLLGIIYSRYVVNPTRARDLLTQARAHLRDLNQIALCDEELRRLG